MVLAKIRAQVVFPTPLGPQNKYACASFPVAMAFFSVVVSASCPTTASNAEGRYFLAETIYSSIMGFVFRILSAKLAKKTGCPAILDDFVLSLHHHLKGHEWAGYIVFGIISVVINIFSW